jgi:hypothetical protein
VVAGQTVSLGDLYDNAGIVMLVPSILPWNSTEVAYLSLHDAVTGDLIAENRVYAAETGIEALPTKVLLRYRDTTHDCWYFPSSQRGSRRPAKPVIDMSGIAWSEIVRGFEIKFGETCLPGPVDLWFPQQTPVVRRPLSGLLALPDGAMNALLGRVTAAVAATQQGAPPTLRQGVPARRVLVGP